MLLDGRKVTRGRTIECDVCIVGAGAAGITLAHELDGRPERVLLLESGGFAPSRAAQALNTGEVADPLHHGPLDRYRVRRFGGTSTVWGGWCAPFDAVDFQVRPHVPYSGWPIGKADLDPFYARAHRYCELGEYAYGVPALPEGQRTPTIPGMSVPGVAEGLWLVSPPTDFGRSYRARLRRSGNVTVCLHSSALTLLADPPRRVDRVRVGCLQGNEFYVRARAFVLAAGGLETTRLLLLSDDVHPKGLGNDHDLVGRFYLSHLTGDLGEVELRPHGGRVVWGYQRTADGVYCRRRIGVDQAGQQSERLLNFAAILDRPAPDDPGHGDGLLSAIFLAKLVRGRASGVSRRQVAAHLGNVLGDVGGVARSSARWARGRLLSPRRLPSLLPEQTGDRFTLHFDAEQAPNPESRVRLDDGVDRFGLRRLQVDWRFTEADVDSVVRSSRILERALVQVGVGRMLLDPEARREHVFQLASVGSHHLGTTRMADDPACGVVDANCRVHGIDNLWIASSSVFATASFARPTLTIVALAIRLADHLKRSGWASA
jgi:choline dehydrogenase-like flavoprotein